MKMKDAGVSVVLFRGALSLLLCTREQGAVVLVCPSLDLDPA